MSARALVCTVVIGNYQRTSWMLAVKLRARTKHTKQEVFKKITRSSTKKGHKNLSASILNLKMTSRRHRNVVLSCPRCCLLVFVFKKKLLARKSCFAWEASLLQGEEFESGELRNRCFMTDSLCCMCLTDRFSPLLSCKLRYHCTL